MILFVPKIVYTLYDIVISEVKGTSLAHHFISIPPCAASRSVSLSMSTVDVIDRKSPFGSPAVRLLTRVAEGGTRDVPSLRHLPEWRDGPDVKWTAMLNYD
ncbi:hypothetical protein EVAR_21338_1 [Eumeta japonica]|uniref:Uncharacterized protein n=1 Tax=Eumeta variegata TaxID=151549 RepID=A0A4C1ZQM8_EUMVA|nr:hypothetical protein EVAR_21338_1 [Eumeta japonica]